jgi:hypothetical protein
MAKAHLGSMIRTLNNLLERVEFKNFQDAVLQNPIDYGLRVRFAKYCLHNYFNHQAVAQTHIEEAVKQFESISKSDLFDLEIYFLMGKYYTGQDDQKAIEVYSQGIRKFNDYIKQNPGLKNEYVGHAFGIALNLLSLDPERMDADLEQFFTIVQKTYMRRFLADKPGSKAGPGNPGAFLPASATGY